MINPSRPIRRDTRVFISAVTRELGSIRSRVRDVVLDLDCLPVVQDHFPPDYRDVAEMLRERIAGCDAVIHIAGTCYGHEPSQRPTDAPRRSYTQLEHDIAVELGKPVYLFLTGKGFPLDRHEPEVFEFQALQQAHRERLTSTDKIYNPVASAEQLYEEIRSLRLKIERLEDELQQIDEEVAIVGRRLGVRLVLSVALGVASLGAIGYVAWRQSIQQGDAQKLDQIQREFAERFLQQMLVNKEITAEEARQRALKELPALVKMSPSEIVALIDSKIPRANIANESPLKRAQAALARGDFDEVLRASSEQNQQGREMAKLEGTAALARFRQSPSPEWNERALAAFSRAMTLADRNSAAGWDAWDDAAHATYLVLSDLARYDEAERLLRDHLRFSEARHGNDSSKVAGILNNLSNVFLFTNRLKEAEPLYLRALRIHEHSHGPNHPHVATDINNLAILLDDTNRSVEAEPLYRRALVIDEGSGGPNQAPVARDLNNLATLLMGTSREAEAEPLLRRTLAIEQDLFGPEQPEVSKDLYNLANLFSITGREAEAEPLYRRALAIAEQTLSPNHPDVATDLSALANLLWTTNRKAEAEPLMVRSVTAMARYQRSIGYEHPSQQVIIKSYRRLLTSRNLGEAEILARIKAASEEPNTLLPVAMVVDQLLGPAKSITDVFTRMDRRREERHESSIWSLKRTDPIAPHLDQLLGPVKKTAKEVLDELDRQHQADLEPSIWLVPLSTSISPCLDKILVKPAK